MKKQNKKSAEEKKAHKVGKNTVYTVIGVVLLILIGIIIVVVVPDIKRVYKIKDELEKKKILYEQDQQNASRAHEYSKLIEGIQQDKELLDLAIIREEQEVEFIQSIEEVSRMVGGQTEIASFSPAKKKKTPTLKLPGQTTKQEEALKQEQEEAKKQEVHLSVKFIGNYRQFLDFYYHLENMTYLFKINSIQMDKSASGGGMNSEEETPPDQIETVIAISFIPK